MMVLVVASCDSAPNRARPALGDGIEWGDAADGTDTDATDTEGTDPDGPDPEDEFLASGIGLTRVEANQGVEIVLARDGEEVAAQDRLAPLIEGRKTLLRAHWQLAEDWVPRTIEAELTLVQAGETSTFIQHRFIDGPSQPGVMGGALDWFLPADRVEPGLRMSIVLREVEGPGGATPGLAPRFPAKGHAKLGIESGPRSLEIVFVPGHVNGTEITMTEAGRAKVEAMLMATLPVQSVHATWHAPVIHDGVFESVDDAWDVLDATRSADGAGPHVYYHLLLHRDGCCSETEFAFQGIGGVAGPGITAWDAEARSALILSRDGTPEVAINTIVHELGHNQGRSHAPCGGAGSPDPEFPYEGAGIGVRGLDIVSDTVLAHEPGPEVGGHADFMGYCWPAWYSDYHWGLNAERAHVLSERAAERGDPVRVLRAIAHPDGRALRWVEWRGNAISSATWPDSPGRARLWTAEGEVQDVPLAVVPLSEGDRSLVVAPVPTAFDPVRAQVVAGPMAGPHVAWVQRALDPQFLRMGR